MFLINKCLVKYFTFIWGYVLLPNGVSSWNRSLSFFNLKKPTQRSIINTGISIRNKFLIKSKKKNAVYILDEEKDEK